MVRLKTCYSFFNEVNERKFKLKKINKIKIKKKGKKKF